MYNQCTIGNVRIMLKCKVLKSTELSVLFLFYF
nr:MAG TPA: hypothetical protein [Caudoviricetes sp.]